MARGNDLLGFVILIQDRILYLSVQSWNNPSCQHVIYVLQEAFFNDMSIREQKDDFA
jgi:hypothetical protein